MCWPIPIRLKCVAEKTYQRAYKSVENVLDDKTYWDRMCWDKRSSEQNGRHVIGNHNVSNQNVLVDNVSAEIFFISIIIMNAILKCIHKRNISGDERYQISAKIVSDNIISSSKANHVKYAYYCTPLNIRTYVCINSLPR
jgi:hypothetical protein